MRLDCQRLECRDVPAVILQTFDSAIVEQLPANWNSWRSNPSGTANVTDGRSVSGDNNFRFGGISTTTVRAWTNELNFDDGQTSVSVYADSLSPATVFARGKDLNSIFPSFYSASVTRGTEIKLHKTVNGVETTLGTLKSTTYLSGQWLKLVLDTQGSTIKVGLIRQDTGQWLTTTGAWSNAETYAITRSDTSITASGLAGVGRAAATASPVVIDDFRIEASSQPTNPQATTPATPKIPKKLSHIRIAQLAYSGNPLGTFEQQKLKTAVDLVIPATSLANKVNSADATVPQLLYTNVSNIYLDLLRDWNEYADKNKLDREQAYYHVSQATAWQGSSPSSIPVHQFWSVTRGRANSTTLTDLTSASRGQASFGVAFGTSGDAVAIGYPEKFRELNFNIIKAAATGYAGVWEYAAAIDANGLVTQWKTLATRTNTTNGLRQSGQITFDPPSDWVGGKQTASGPYLNFIRFRTTSGTAAQAPEAKTILGRDFAATVNGKGTIPAFDTAADRNGDGYLTDTEYASRKSGFDARFKYESRLFYPFYGPMRYVTNPSSQGIRNWAVDFAKRQLAANPLYDGLFVDNSNGKLPFGSEIKVLESTTTYTADSAALVGAVYKGVSPKLVIANTVGSIKEADGVAASVPGSLEEFLLRPTEASWSRFNDVADIVKRRLATPNSPYLIMDSHPGSQTVGDPRVQIGTLAYYYLLGDPYRTMLMMYGGFKPSAAWQDGWIKAAETDVGKPKGEYKQFARGADPENTKLEYRVYSREYESALVLYKPRSYTAGVTGTISNSTGTAHQLGARYRTLNADGTLGPVITQITLRNGEGAVLMKVK